ncbi:MAG: glycine cleavage system aminomethyltransferase GcvT [Myxococcota bacterium]
MTTLRTTPFHGHHESAGAKMVDFAGFHMPVTYTGLAEEHRRTREASGLFDVSHMGEVRVRGPQAEDALMWLLSNAIRRLKPGQAQYNAMCNDGGGVVDDVFVYRLAEDDFLVCVNAANREKDFAWMTAQDRTGASITDEGNDWAQIAIQGPQGVAIVAGLTALPVSDLGRHHFLRGSFAGVDDCIVARTGYTGEDGFEVFLPAADCVDVWPTVLAAGAEQGLGPVGLGARDTLRLEVGNCLYGQELTDETTPLQAGLGWITKLKKPGGFLGAEAIASRRETDPRRLVGIVMQGKRIARGGMDVRVGDQVVGTVTSGTLGPSVGRPIALAYVDRAYLEPGTALQVDVRGKLADGVVVTGSFLEAK